MMEPQSRGSELKKYRQVVEDVVGYRSAKTRTARWSPSTWQRALINSYLAAMMTGKGWIEYN